MSSPDGTVDASDGSPMKMKRKADEIAATAAIDISVREPGQVPTKEGRYDNEDNTNNTRNNASVNSDASLRRNSAFVFIKPHANTERTRAMVTATLSSRNLRIEKEGEITAEQIDTDR